MMLRRSALVLASGWKRRKLPASRCAPCSRASAVPTSTMSSSAGHQHRQVRVAHILSDTAEDLQQVMRELQGGADFAAVAKARSKCQSNRRGGELGWLSRGAYLPEFEEAAFSAPVGGIATAVTGRGHHAISVLAEKFEAPVQQMDVAELAQLLNDIGLAEEVQFVDVREPFEHRIAKLPRFQLMPLSTFEEWSSKVGTEVLERERETVVLCHHGVRSMQMAQRLVKKV